jgi:UDP-glucose 6-dehydrogenase
MRSERPAPAGRSSFLLRSAAFPVAFESPSVKPDTDDLRDAPSLHIAGHLLPMGARVRAYDPIAMPACRKQHPDLKIRYCDSPEELAAGADALVLGHGMAGVPRP